MMYIYGSAACDEKKTRSRKAAALTLQTRSSVLQGEVFVLELVTIDGFATSAIVLREVTALTHEVRDNTVEGAAFVAKPLLTGTQCTEVLSSLWYNITS